MKQAICVTGAASGIGRATARLFAARGWYVGLFDVNQAGLAALAAELGPEKSCARPLDVARPADCRDAVAFFSERASGRMDVLFNCAGILRMGRFESLTIEEQLRTIDINLGGVVACTYAAFDLLRRTPGAHVVTMGSASGLYGVPELAVYSATKFAVRGLTEALSLEFERHGITVCDLMPPYVNTPLVTDQTYSAGTVRSLGVHLEPETIAEVVWRAAHGRKLHWIPTASLKVLAFMQRLFPFVNRPAMKYLSRL
jgi:NAD(P)-dependent dehydrogenase (short-subunit alcohol dehydrogenase family)